MWVRHGKMPFSVEQAENNGCGEGRKNIDSCYTVSALHWHFFPPHAKIDFVDQEMLTVL